MRFTSSVHASTREPEHIADKKKPHDGRGVGGSFHPKNMTGKARRGSKKRSAFERPPSGFDGTRHSRRGAPHLWDDADLDGVEAHFAGQQIAHDHQAVARFDAAAFDQLRLGGDDCPVRIGVKTEMQWRSAPV